jgi:ATP-binding cassette subfamily G (WHITE) protein 1
MSARLRLPTSISLEEKDRLVEDILDTMRLTKARDTIIGNPTVKGVSGGERKRTALSMELVTNPAIL